MNGTKRSAGTIGFVFSAALIGALTGCTTYVEQQPPRAVYVPPPPVYATPPPVYVAPPPAYVPPPPVEVGISVGVTIRSENDFHEPLNSYGRWEVVGTYGRCWIPSGVEADWRPYSNGHWERTEAGWYWASDEPWAWATYHYGRWDVSPEFGWYWVPQTQWAPAWVSWHHGGGYLGWAPLQPSVRMAATGPVEVNVALIAPRAYVFVEEKRFLEPVRPTTVIVNNTTIINKTVNITNIKVVNNTVINEGPRTQVIEQVSGRRIQAVAAHDLRRKEEAVVLARQKITPVPRAEKPPTAVRRELQPQQNNGQLESEQRARESARKAQAESQRTAKELEAKTQLESEQRARELARKAQAESQRTAKELEAKAQLASEQRARELARKTQAERSAKEMDAKAQLASEQRARQLQKKPVLVPAVQAKHEQIVNEQRRTNAVNKGQRKKVTGPQTPPEKPVVPPPTSQ